LTDVECRRHLLTRSERHIASGVRAAAAAS
jgi:hypothetical protein